MATKAEKAEQEESRQYAEGALRSLLREDDRIATVTIHGRGLTDWVEVFAIDGRDIVRITYWVALVTRYRMTEKGIAMGGGNYSKPHEVVSNLSRVLYGRGNALVCDRLIG